MMIVDKNGNPFMASVPYDAADTTGMLGGWGTIDITSTGTDWSTSVIRSRARNLVRNSPIGKGITDSLVSSMIGSSVDPSWNGIEPGQKTELQDMWKLSSRSVGLSVLKDVNALWAAITRAMIVDGESFARPIFLPASSGEAVPIKLQIFESDQVPLDSFTHKNNRRVVNGVELGRNGQIKYYHVLKEHPGLFGDGKTTRIKGSDIYHVCRPMRNELRPVSWFAPVMRLIKSVDDYIDYENTRKRRDSMLSGFLVKKDITQQIPAHMQGISAVQTGGTSNPVRSIELKSDALSPLPVGYDVVFPKHNDNGNFYNDIVDRNLMLIARGTLMLHEVLSNNYAGVTFSSLRAAFNELRRLHSQVRDHTIVSQAIRPFMAHWTRQAILTGRITSISVEEYAARPWVFENPDINFDSWPGVKPLEDTLNDIFSVRAGFTTQGRVSAARNGVDHEQLCDERSDELAIQAAKELIFDTNPGQVNKSGTYQNIEESELRGSDE